MGYDHLRFAAEPFAVRAALQRLETGAALAPLTGDGRDCVLLVMAEVLNNVAEHAYRGAVGPVAVSLRTRGEIVMARVVDQGVAAPALTNGKDYIPDDLPEGGFGFGLIRALASEIGQQRRMGCNVLRFHLGEQ